MNINDFLISPISEIKDLAERAIEIENMFNNGQISSGEYKELANDLLELKDVNKDMIDLELMRELWMFVDTLKNIKFFASL